MRLLAAHGADPKIPSRMNVTPLMVAAGSGFSQGGSPGTDAEALEAVKLCLELGNGVNEVAVYPESDRFDPRFDGETPLHGAAVRGADGHHPVPRRSRREPRGADQGRLHVVQHRRRRVHRRYVQRQSARRRVAAAPDDRPEHHRRRTPPGEGRDADEVGHHSCTAAALVLSSKTRVSWSWASCSPQSRQCGGCQSRRAKEQLARSRPDAERRFRHVPVNHWGDFESIICGIEGKFEVASLATVDLPWARFEVVNDRRFARRAFPHRRN